MEKPDHQALAADLEQQVDDLQRHADEVGEQINETRQDWERKRSATDVPGANPPESDAGSEDESDESA